MEICGLKQEERVSRADGCLFCLCLADIMFFPYFWAVTVPYSMPLVFWWLAKRYAPVSKTREFALFCVLAAAMAASTLLSYAISPQRAYRNTTIMIEMLAVFAYYLMFSYYLGCRRVSLKAALYGFTFFVAAFAVLYNVDKASYQQLKYVWNPRMGTVWSTDNLEGYRFGFFWMDENNVGYMTNAVVLFLLCNEKTSLFAKAALLFALSLVVISCMSSGCLIASVVSVGLYLVLTAARLIAGRARLRTTLLNAALFFLLIAALYFAARALPAYLGSDVVREAVARFETNTASSRISIWKNILQNANIINYLLIGQGGDTFLNGVKVNPHNGHLFFILAYGVPAYAIFMYVFFRKRKSATLYSYLYMIPLWVGFSINIMIGELKLSAIMALLVAASASRASQRDAPGAEEVRHAA